MKSLLTPGRRTLAASLLLGMLAPAGAQSLGPARAEAWVGRPLEMTVPARFESDREECVQAQVLYGDQAVPARATLTGAPGERRVRIVADALIDEPVVTVSLRAGCRSTVTREYTVLPGMASEQVLAAAAARTAGAAAGMPLGPVASAIQAAGTTQVLTRRAVNVSDREGASRARAVRPARLRDAGGMPRLRLDMWEPEPTTMLRVTAQLSEPGHDAARRATAALLWQALNADPSELIRTSASLQRLENEMAQLRTSANQTRAEMAALRQALEAPPSGFQLPGALAQGLLLLLLAGAGTGAFLWWRTARQQHAGGWNGMPLDATLDPVAQPQAGTERRMAQADAAPDAAPPEPLAASASGLPAAADVDAEPVVPPATIDFDLDPVAPVPAASARATHVPLIRVETLAATFQEVEFLSSLGLWDDASDVLKAYLEGTSAPAPIAYFELMRLYALDQDTAGEAAVRRRYAQVFGSQAPPLEQITAASGLQARAELASHITRSWRTPQALDMIDDLLFAAPGPAKALSLEAGRDLLCLYQVALELDRQEALDEGGPAGDDAGSGLAPWAHADDAGQAHAAVQAAAGYEGGHGFGLDLDLNAAPSPLPESQAFDDGGLSLVPPERDRQEAEDSAAMLAEFEAIAGRSDPARSPAAPGIPDDYDPFSAAVASESRRPLPR